MSVSSDFLSVEQKMPVSSDFLGSLQDEIKRWPTRLIRLTFIFLVLQKMKSKADGGLLLEPRRRRSF
jgi:hypothetical protein